MSGCCRLRLHTDPHGVDEFEDIPMPRGLTYRPTDSVVIESPSVKAARLVYRGRIEPGSLGSALRTTLEGNGWRYVNITSNPQHGTAQVYEKDGNALLRQPR